MNYVSIEKENMNAFAGVLYPGFVPGDRRITIGAYGEDGTVQGAVSMILMEDQYTCDWLYVHPECRGRGVGTGLFDQILEFIGATGIVYPLSAVFEVRDEDRELYGFFLSRDDVMVDYSHRRFYIRPEEIEASKMLKKGVHTSYKKKLYAELDAESRREIKQKVREQQCLVIGDSLQWDEDSVPDMNLVLYDGDDVVSFLFFRRREDKCLELSYLYSRSPMGVLQIIVEAAKIVAEKYPGYGIVYDTVRDEAEAVSRKVFPENDGICIYEAVW